MMNRRSIFLFLVAGAAAFLSPAAEEPLRSVVEVRALSEDADPTPRPFTLDGTVTALMPFFVESESFVLESGGHALRLVNSAGTPLRLGDRVTAHGVASHDPRLGVVALVRALAVRGHEDLPEPPTVTPDDLQDPALLCRRIRIAGTVTDVFRDDIDAAYACFLVKSRGRFFYASLHAPSVGLDTLRDTYAGAEVRFTGVCEAHVGDRVFANRYVQLYELGDAEVVKSAVLSPFDAPPLEIVPHASPDALNRLSYRTATGRVLAVWGGRQFLLASDDGHVIEATLAEGERAPSLDAHVKVAGLPQTDLLHVKLALARVRSADRAAPPSPLLPRDTDPDELFVDERGTRCTQHRFHGRFISLTGIVLAHPSADADGERISLACGAQTVSLDVSACPAALADIPLGAKVRVSAVCVLSSDVWRPDAPIPRVHGFFLVLRSPADVTVLARPSWWTPEKMLVVFLSLLAVFVVLYNWVRILNRLVYIRSRQLLKKQIAKERADFKAAERTRLAVELHDSLSQNLSGLACQISASKIALAHGADETRKRLETAERMLLSSRTELQRCLFDLRGDALEGPDFDSAIRKSLAPIIGDAALILRCSASRRRIGDTTAHAVICIIRELAANALRHGQAHEIRVALRAEERLLLFSVEDDGCGFDPAHCAGVKEGHFGLSGIRERVARLNGTLTIDSAPGKGAYAKVQIPLPEQT